MLCPNCKEELPDHARFCLECGTPIPHDTGLNVKQKLETVQGDVVGVAAGKDALSAGLDANIAQSVRTVESGGTMVGAALGGEVQVGGEHKQEIIHGDKIEVSEISGTGVAVGREGQVTVAQGINAQELARLFSAVYQQIEARPDDPDVDKQEVTETVAKVEEETVKGEEASPKKVERWLKTLSMMAPDILEVTLACLTSPVAGVATVIRKVAEKAQGNAAPA